MVPLLMILRSYDDGFLQAPAILFFVVASDSNYHRRARCSRDRPTDPLLGEMDWMVILGMGNINATKALCFGHCFGPQEVQEPIGEAYFSLKQNGRRGRRNSALAYSYRYAKDDYKCLDCGAL
jgi:hypothetical protein